MRRVLIKMSALAIGIMAAIALLLLWRKVEILAYGIHQESVIDAVVCGVLGSMVTDAVARWVDG